MKPTPELIDAVAKSCGRAEVVEKLLARALAACALREHDLYCVTCRRYVEGPHEARCERGELLERAVEGKS